jgi:hypothetical protein
MNKLLEGLFFLLHRAGQVPFNSRMHASGPEIADELSAQVGPRADRPSR